jgi:hypothetical protein
MLPECDQAGGGEGPGSSYMFMFMMCNSLLSARALHVTRHWRRCSTVKDSSI